MLRGDAVNLQTYGFTPLRVRSQGSDACGSYQTRIQSTSICDG
jgi:hypothetical protein